MLRLQNGSAGELTVEQVGANDADKSVSLRVCANGVPASLILLAANGTVLRADPLPATAACTAETMLMHWIPTKQLKPPKGRIAIWVDDDIFSANCLGNGIVDCPVLQLTWDLASDPEDQWFSAWQLLSPPLSAEAQLRANALDALAFEAQSQGHYE